MAHRNIKLNQAEILELPSKIVENIQSSNDGYMELTSIQLESQLERSSVKSDACGEKTNSALPS